MTECAPTGILKLDRDKMLSYHYYRRGWHREPMFRICGSRAFFLDPGTRREVEIGLIVRPAEGVLIAVFSHVS